MELVEFLEAGPHVRPGRSPVWGTELPVKISAPQGREVSSPSADGQRPRKTASPHPHPSPRLRREGCPSTDGRGVGLGPGVAPPATHLVPLRGATGGPGRPRMGGSTGLQCALNTRHCRPLQTVLKRLLVSLLGSLLKKSARAVEKCSPRRKPSASSPLSRPFSRSPLRQRGNKSWRRPFFQGSCAGLSCAVGPPQRRLNARDLKSLA